MTRRSAERRHSPVARPQWQPAEGGAKQIAVLAAQETGATDVEVLRGRFERGGGNAPHRHDRQELVVVLRGRARYLIDGVAVDVGAGDTLLIEPMLVHSFEAISAFEGLAIYRVGTTTIDVDEREPGVA